MTAENWLTLIGIIFSAVIGYFVKYTLDKKAQFSSKNAEIKREMYQEYVDFILGFLNDMMDQSKEATPEQTREIVDKMRSFHRKAVLYSSPKVVNAYSNMLQYFYKHSGSDTNTAHSMVLMTNVFKEMRSDIGLSNRGLRSGAIRLMRPLITDYDSIIKPKEFALLLNAKLSTSNSQNANVRMERSE